jgi:hypothetical protein
MDNWDYIVFYGYDNLENVKPFRNSNNSMDTHAPSANTSKPLSLVYSLLNAHCRTTFSGNEHTFNGSMLFCVRVKG